MKAAVSALVLLVSTAFAVPTSFTTTKEDAVTVLVSFVFSHMSRHLSNVHGFPVPELSRYFSSRVHWT
jgi:hypothetical protein